MAGDLAGMFQHIADAVAKDGAKGAADGAGVRFMDLERPRVPVRSGRLRGSLAMKPGGGGTRSTSTVSIGHGVPYAEIQNDGGVIHVKNKRVLSDGETFFGKSVTIPAQHYWSLDGKQGAIAAAAERAVQAVIDGAA